MGNALRGSRRRTTKIMKIDGETTKHKTPIQAMEVTNTHPGHVLLDSDAVKRYGIRAKPLDPAQYLEPRRVYFLVELPKSPDPVTQNRVPRRVRSGGIHMGAKERLESLMLSRRSVSDLSALKPLQEEAAAVRVRMRLPKAEVERLMRQSKDQAEAAQRIMDLCVMDKSGSARPDKGEFGLSGHNRALLPLPPQQRSALGVGDGCSSKKKRVGFLPVTEKDIQFAVAS